MNNLAHAYLTVQDPFTKQPNKSVFDRWMSGQGPAHLFVYYQKPYRINEQGEDEDLRQPIEFVVTDGKCLPTLGGKRLPATNLDLNRSRAPSRALPVAPSALAPFLGASKHPWGAWRPRRRREGLLDGAGPVRRPLRRI